MGRHVRATFVAWCASILKISRADSVVCALTAGAVLALGSAQRQTTPRPDAGGTPRRLPVGLAAAVSATIGGDEPRFAASVTRREPVTHGGGLETVFEPAGPALRAAGGKLSLHLEAVGRKGAGVRVGSAAPMASGNRVIYRRGEIDEWYANGPLGLEQGFTLRRPPAGEGRLTVAMRMGGPLRPRLSRGQIVFADRAGKTAARYGGLFALDAAGAGSRPGWSFSAAGCCCGSTMPARATRSRSTRSSRGATS